MHCLNDDRVIPVRMNKFCGAGNSNLHVGIVLKFETFATKLVVSVNLEKDRGSKNNVTRRLNQSKVCISSTLIIALILSLETCAIEEIFNIATDNLPTVLTHLSTIEKDTIIRNSWLLSLCVLPEVHLA